MSTNLQEIIMLSRSVCDSAGQVTSKTMGLMRKERLMPGGLDAMEQQLTCLESELVMLGQVIDFFKLYSVDNQSWPG